MAADTYHLPVPEQFQYLGSQFSSYHDMMQPTGLGSGVAGGLPAETYNTIISNGTSAPTDPLQDVVNNAVRSNTIDNDVLAQITTQITRRVMNDLQASGYTPNSSNSTNDLQASSYTPISSNSTPRPNTFQPDQPPLYQPAPIFTGHRSETSPTSPTSSSVPPRYTPPSPNRHDISSLGSSSPEPPISEAASFSSIDTNKSRRRRRSSQTSPSRYDDTSTQRSRPRPVRVPTAIEETTLEKVWQPLFDNGRPTPRLGQFLRGLANHIIEDCVPKNSMVVTPGKMADFMGATRIADEIYSWHSIFGGGLTNVAISKIYRELRCQHHLVQLNHQDTPNIPGLTPVGFEAFMTTLIQAYPNQEFDRLTKALLDMPISNAENVKERFPKEIPRRLFPKHDDLRQQQRLTAALTVDSSIHHRTSIPMPPPPATQPPQGTAFTDGTRNPYPSVFGSAVDDEDLPETVFPIERERMPYTAREGSGKRYEDNGPSHASARPRAESFTRPTRANTANPLPSYTAHTGRATDMPHSGGNRHHRMSMNAGSVRFGTSPPKVNPFTRSEGASVGDVPSQYFASNIHDSFEDPRRSTRRPADDVYGSSPRAVPYDYAPGNHDSRRSGGTDGYGSVGGSYPTGGFVQPPPPRQHY